MRVATISPDAEVLTVPVAARVLGLTPLTVRMHVLRGLLPGRQVGRMMFLVRSDVEAYRAARNANAATTSQHGGGVG